jgi:arylsulfatase A-like enzyme
MDQRDHHRVLETNHAADRLTDRRVYSKWNHSKWNPFWGVLGIGLPLTFAGQVRPASLFLGASELVPLYATEWIMLAVPGLIVGGSFAVLDMFAVKSRWRIEPGTVAKVGFAIVIAASFLFGVLTWFETLRNAPQLTHLSKCLLFVLVAPAGIVVSRGWFRAEIATLATMARFLSLAGSATLLSLPFVGGTMPLASTDRAMAINRPASRPNIVLISIDTLAAEHLQPYGSRRQTSPNIAEFSSHAIVFQQFHANANFTTPAIASILTGVSPWTHRALQLEGHANHPSIVESLPARLHQAGYLTAYFGSNPFAGARRQGYSAYFDHEDSDIDWIYGPCFDALTLRLPYLCPAAENPLLKVSYFAAVRAANAVGLLKLSPHSDLERMVARVGSWTEGHDRAPVFLWVHFFPPHEPYAAPEPWLGQFDRSAAARNAFNSDFARETSSNPARFFDMSLESASRINTLEARYDESIAYVDYYIGKLISVIRQNLGPNTAILLTADHGESFDHGYGSHSGVMLYEDLIHIPLIIELPRAATAAGRRDELAAQIDLAPTIAAIAGVAPSPSWDGQSLLALPKNSELHTVFAMNFEQNDSRGRLRTGAVAVLRSNWKLVRFFGEPRYSNMPQLQTQLFDLTEDPHEHKNVAAVHADIVATLSAQIDEQLAVHGNPTGE